MYPVPALVPSAATANWPHRSFPTTGVRAARAAAEQVAQDRPAGRVEGCGEGGSSGTAGMGRPRAAFLAQLIAARERLPQARALRRADPQVAAAAYAAIAALR
jgi:hypothetical protein